MSRGKRNPDTLFLSQTAISPEKTAVEIQELLGRAGAQRVMSDYENGEIVAISFSILVEGGQVLFRLPIRWKNYFKVLQRAWARSGPRKAEPSEEQAKRTAWRVAKAWLEAQLAFVNSEMVRLEEVMLPHMVHSTGKTLYELYAAEKFIEHKQ